MTTPTSSKIAAIGACGLCTVTFTALTRTNAARIASATARRRAQQVIVLALNAALAVVTTSE